MKKFDVGTKKYLDKTYIDHERSEVVMNYLTRKELKLGGLVGCWESVFSTHHIISSSRIRRPISIIGTKSSV